MDHCWTPKDHFRTFCNTPGPLYNMLHYNTIFDITLITVGPQLVILDYFCYVYTFYSHYTTACIANTEIGLEPNNSVIKRLWCISIQFYNPRFNTDGIAT